MLLAVCYILYNHCLQKWDYLPNLSTLFSSSGVPRQDRPREGHLRHPIEATQRERERGHQGNLLPGIGELNNIWERQIRLSKYAATRLEVKEI